MTGLAAENGLRLANAAALCDWYAGEEAAGGEDRRERCRRRPRWGLVCSLGLHAVVVALTLTVSMAGVRARTEPPPVLLDVVFGAPGGDGSPGDGAPGPEGKAGGSGPGPQAAEAPRPASVAPAPTVAAPVKPARPQPVTTVHKRAQPRPKPTPAPASVTSRTAPAADAAQPASQTASASVSGGTSVAGDVGVAGSGGGGAGGGQGADHGKGGVGDGTGAGGHGGGAYDGVFGSGNGPTFAKRVPPVYPPQARRFGREGEVVLRLSIDAAGRLLAAEVVKEGGAGFDAAALAAVRASSYRPALLAGQPVPSRALLRVRFQLSDA